MSQMEKSRYYQEILNIFFPFQTRMMNQKNIRPSLVITGGSAAVSKSIYTSSMDCFLQVENFTQKEFNWRKKIDNFPYHKPQLFLPKLVFGLVQVYRSYFSYVKIFFFFYYYTLWPCIPLHTSNWRCIFSNSYISIHVLVLCFYFIFVF